MTKIQLPTTFARRVRELLDARKQSIVELSERAELAPSLVSKLLTDTDAARREPRIEHALAIARALELAPRELVLGTTAEALLGEWVPRTEFDEESRVRAAAQTEAAQLRTELAGARSEVASLRLAVDHLSQEVTSATQKLGDVEAKTRRELTALRVAQESAEARLASALVERNQALAAAESDSRAWANARSQILQLQREVTEAKGAASAGWMAALVGTVGGAILGAASAEPVSKKRSRRRA